MPKDGPSAGVTMVTALVSALSNTPVANDVAMTGEVTLTGRVLPIGGLREKTMAAYAAGVHTVLIPKANLGDLDEIDPEARAALKFIPVSNVKEVLSKALRGSLATEGTVKFYGAAATAAAGTQQFPLPAATENSRKGAPSDVAQP